MEPRVEVAVLFLPLISTPQIPTLAWPYFLRLYNGKVGLGQGAGAHVATWAGQVTNVKSVHDCLSQYYPLFASHSQKQLEISGSFTDH